MSRGEALKFGECFISEAKTARSRTKQNEPDLKVVSTKVFYKALVVQPSLTTFLAPTFAGLTSFRRLPLGLRA